MNKKPVENSKYIQSLYLPVKYSSPLKRSMSGYEIEMCLVDEKGDVSNDSDKILTDCKKDNKKFPIVEEVAHNMVEIFAMPHAKIHKTAIYLIDNVKKVMDVCEKHNLQMIPLGTYPGKFKSSLRKKKRYMYSAKAVGVAEYSAYFPRCFGFHYHYAMPRGMYNPNQKHVKKKFHSKIMHTFLDSYNMLIAADPALTTLTQSSPFANGKYYAKDTRMLFFRGGKKLKYKGAFNNLQLLGGLQPYKHTLSDLLHTLDMKDKKGRMIFRKAGVPESFISKKPKLDLMWNPVKVNKIGTLEQRGLDTTHIDICLGVSVLINFILRAIQQEFYHVIPSDIGITEPFKLEGNVIFVPSHTHVRNVLQYKAAYCGLADKELYRYTSRLYDLSRKLLFPEYKPALKPIKEMLSKKMTVSDQIIQYVKRKGYSTQRAIPQEVSRQISLLHAKKLTKGIDKLREVFKTLDT